MWLLQLSGCSSFEHRGWGFRSLLQLIRFLSYSEQHLAAEKQCCCHCEQESVLSVASAKQCFSAYLSHLTQRQCDRVLGTMFAGGYVSRPASPVLDFKLEAAEGPSPGDVGFAFL